MISLIISVVLAASPCAEEAKKGSADKLLTCAEGQTGARRRYLFALAYYRQGSLEAGDYEAARAKAESPKELHAALATDFAVARAEAEKLIKSRTTSQCVVLAKQLGIPATDEGGGFSVEGMVPDKKLWTMSELQRKKLRSLDGEELDALLDVSKVDLGKLKQGRGSLAP